MITKWKVTNGELWVRVDGRPWLLLHVYTTEAMLEACAQHPSFAPSSTTA